MFSEALLLVAMASPLSLPVQGTLGDYLTASGAVVEVSSDEAFHRAVSILKCADTCILTDGRRRVLIVVWGKSVPWATIHMHLMDIGRNPGVIRVISRKPFLRGKMMSRSKPC